MRRVELWVLGSCLAVAALVFALHRPSSPAPASPQLRAAPALAGLPPGAAFVVSLDIESLRASPLASLLDPNRELLGVGKLGDVCGFDPTAAVREVAIAIPEPGQGARGANPDFGLVASGDFQARRVAECVAQIVKRRGGDPATSKLDSFVSVRDRGRPLGEVAVRDGGPLLLGGGSYLREMVDAAEGRAPTLLGDEAHSALRRAIGGPRPILATWIARPGWLERWLELDDPSGSPLANVRAGAFAVELSPSLVATVLFACESDTSGAGLAKWVEGVETQARSGMERSFGVDPVRDAKVSREPQVVRVTLTLDALRTLRVIASLLPSEEPAPAGSSDR